MSISLERAISATHARVHGAERLPAELDVVTDSRTLERGQTFLALHGERFDGHDHLDEALAKGASALVVDDAQRIPHGVPALVVADTRRAYMHLAAASREQFSGKVVAITGSTGKTTTKHFLGSLLSAHYGADRVLVTQANENNEIGVSKLMLRAGERHRVAVVELGARHSGEIEELAAIARPHIGVLTNIGEAHLEIFGSRERLAATKWGIFAFGAQAVLNSADAASIERAPSLDVPPVWFGTQPSGEPGVYIPDRQTLLLTVDKMPRTQAIQVKVPGEHNRANLAAAVAAALLLGVEPTVIAAAIPGLTMPAGRFETIALSDGTRLIYDAYNANLSGMLAALDAFRAEPATRHIAVLSSMAELGPQAPQMHERVGARTAELHLDMLLASGEYAEPLVAGAIAAGMPRSSVMQYASNEEAAHWILENGRAGDLVLLKGSRKYAMERIVEQLQRSQEARA